jgi:hypothetical protein
MGRWGKGEERKEREQRKTADDCIGVDLCALETYQRCQKAAKIAFDEARVWASTSAAIRVYISTKRWDHMKKWKGARSRERA